MSGRERPQVHEHQGTRWMTPGAAAVTPAEVRDRAVTALVPVIRAKTTTGPYTFASELVAALSAAGLLAAEPTADRLARALHDADCGCGDYDQDEDPRYITAARAALAAEPTGEPEAVEGMQELEHGGALSVTGSHIMLEGNLTVRDEDTCSHASVLLTMDELTSLRDALTAYLQRGVAEPTGGTT